MVRIQLSLVSSGGNVMVNGSYVSGTNPVFLERIVVEQLDSSGNVVGVSTHRLNQSMDPVPGSNTLVAVTPSGSNVRGMRATAHYLEVDKSERSAVLNL